MKGYLKVCALALLHFLLISTTSAGSTDYDNYNVELDGEAGESDEVAIHLSSPSESASNMSVNSLGLMKRDGEFRYKRVAWPAHTLDFPGRYDPNKYTLTCGERAVTEKWGNSRKVGTFARVNPIYQFIGMLERLKDSGACEWYLPSGHAKCTQVFCLDNASVYICNDNRNKAKIFSCSDLRAALIQILSSGECYNDDGVPWIKDWDDRIQAPLNVRDGELPYIRAGQGVLGKFGGKYDDNDWGVFVLFRHCLGTRSKPDEWQKY